MVVVVVFMVDVSFYLGSLFDLVSRKRRAVFHLL